MTGDQWVILRLEGHEFALPLQQVVEVRRMVALQFVPEAPAWLAGVANLRGRVLPVIDLRARLGLPPQAPRLDTRIIVAEAGWRLIGLLADEVTDVLTMPAAPIELPRGSPGQAERAYQAVQVAERVVPVLDLDRLTVGADGLDVRLT